MTTEKTNFLPGFENAYFFAIFNALSFQVILASPMLLYAQSLGATATVFGIIAGLMPLLVIFQIPAAQYVARVGFKRFVYAGWGIRVGFIFAMALVPLTGHFLNSTTQLALLLMLLFCFNLSRGISSAAWLPWITALIPVTGRGRYLLLDATSLNVASFFSFLLSAFWLGSLPAPWRFAALFSFSGLMGAISLTFLKRIPDADAPEEVRTSNTPVPWREIARFKPFRRLLRSVVGWALSYGGMTAFTVAFLKSEVGMSERAILILSAFTFLGGLGSLWFLGSRLDKLGSKPVLTFSFAVWIAIALGWALLASGLWSPQLGIILALQFLMGLFNALTTMSNTRLAMSLIPAMGRNHFFALYSVAYNVMLGLAPILWGLFIDLIGDRHMMSAGFDWNRFSLFFVAVALCFCVTLGLARRLEEPAAVTMEELLREILIQSPQRAWVRIWMRE